MFVDIEEPENGSISTAEAVFFRVSPNPSSITRLEFLNPLPDKSFVQLISVSGQIIDQKILASGIRNHEFEVPILPKGVYWIMLEMQGSVIQREKLIVN
ncbi:MAG: T9SS C-terminal target domain-containing protein [Bacteroidetes bacterium]|nr:MAG: T9SS C-terminal target domain-containing protein [Bacteroidota bacterium]